MATDLTLPVGHVSDTAYMVAAYRLLESRRRDAHFHDELAAKLLGEQAQTYLDQARPARFGSWMMAVRTCIIDQFIAAKVAAGCDMVVNLAAGLDTRPYRLDTLPASLRWLEVDFAPIIAHKNRVLGDVAPRCQLERRVVDLTEPAARAELMRHIAASSSQALVLTEGLLIYLEAAVVTALATELRSLPQVRWWVTEFSTQRFLEWAVSQWVESGTNARAAPASGEQLQPVGFRFYPDDLRGFFAALGWHVTEFREFAEQSRILERLPPTSADVPLEKALVAVGGSGYGVMEKAAAH